MAAALLVAGCGGSTWQREFTERLEGSSAAVEEKLPELTSSASQGELFDASMGLARKLAFRGELIEGLDPPDGCEAVQEEGRRKVNHLAQQSSGLLPNLTPYLLRSLPGPFEKAIEEFEKIEREAEKCASE